MGVDFFQDRNDAGRRLAEALLEYRDKDPIVLGIPKGGVPVGFEVASRLGAPFDVIIPRKIPIPWNPEVGIGAITSDGTMVLNSRMIEGLGLQQDEIEQAAEEVRREVDRRTVEYRGDRPFPDVEGRPVILVDDGLASGYTMLAAIESIRKHKPSDIIVAVPVASIGAVRLVKPKVNVLVALIISERLPFAVASFYMVWRDLTDEEVIGYINRFREFAEDESRAA